MSQGYAPVPQGPYQPPPTAPGGYGYPPQAIGGYNQSLYPTQGYANQPISQPGVIPPPVFSGIQYVYVPDAMAELSLSTGVLIRQQAQFLEQITGCESPNRYFVFSQSPQAGMKLLFKCKEHSNCCMRNCCPANSREFNMVIKHVASAGGMNDDFTTPFAIVNRPFKCTCCCLERPEMLVSLGSNNQPLGRIKQPYTCCDPVFAIYDNTGKVRYTIHANCCQCGLICKNNFCGKLSEVIFYIYEEGSYVGSPVGQITKKTATAAELVTSADSYQINFPLTADATLKMLIVVAGLMIDYQYFEESASGNDNHSSVYL